MKTALLECPTPSVDEHVRPCITSMACWWREIRELEVLLGYENASLQARDVWDELLAAEIPAPREALYGELRECVKSWQRISRGQGILYPPLLDRFVWVAMAEQLALPQYAPLAAFRLRQRLCGMRKHIVTSKSA
jgi:hypothetical protein